MHLNLLLLPNTLATVEPLSLLASIWGVNFWPLQSLGLVLYKGAFVLCEVEGWPG